MGFGFWWFGVGVAPGKAVVVTICCGWLCVSPSSGQWPCLVTLVPAMWSGCVRDKAVGAVIYLKD